MYPLIGQRRILIHQNRQEAHVGTMTERCIYREWHTLLTGLQLVFHIFRHLVETSLLINGLLHLLTDISHGVVHEPHTLRCIKSRSSLHQSDVSLTDKIFHRHPLAFILTSNRDDKPQVCLHELGECPLVTFPDSFGKLTFLLIGKQRLLTDFVQISV